MARWNFMLFCVLSAMSAVFRVQGADLRDASGFEAVEMSKIYGQNKAASEIQLWAPGAVNPDRGTIEIEAQFLVNPKEFTQSGDYVFVARMKGSGNEKPTVGGLIFCPVTDKNRHGLLWIIRKNGKTYEIRWKNANLEPGRKTHKIVGRWGDGKMSLWVNGVNMGEKPCKGMGVLPAVMDVGGFQGLGSPRRYFEVKSVKISDVPRDDAYCSAKKVTGADAHTTYMKYDGEAVSAVTDWQKKSFKAGIFPVYQLFSDVSAYADDKVSLPCRMVNFSDSPVVLEVKTELKSQDGKVVASKKSTIDIPAGEYYGELSVEMPKVPQSGFYSCSFNVCNPGGSAIKYASQAASINFASLPECLKDLPRGKLGGIMGHHHVFDRGFPPRFLGKGLDWARAWDPRLFRWSGLEPKKGEYDWDRLDKYVNRCISEKMQVLAVLGYPPAWASSYSPAEVERIKNSSPRNRNNKYLHVPERYMPRDLNEWAGFLKVLVKRYRDRVKCWEIYNEIDFMPPAYFATFSGTQEDYIALLKVSYETIKSVDPQAKVLISGFNLGHSNNPNFAVELLEKGAAKYFDIFSLHGYCSDEIALKSLEAARKAKPGVDYWQTEVCFVHRLHGPPTPTQISAGTQHMVEHLFWSLGQGVKRYFWHSGEFDHHTRMANPEFAAMCCLWALVGACDEYSGVIEAKDMPQWLKGWRLRMNDGRFLYVLSTSQATKSPQVLFRGEGLDVGLCDAVGLFAQTLRPKSENGLLKLQFSDLAYMISPVELSFAGAKRQYSNMLSNSDFEIYEGDVGMGWENARPSAWSVSRSNKTKGKVSLFKEGGNTMLQLACAMQKGKVMAVHQRCPIDEAGKYEFSVDAMNISDKEVTMTIKIYDDSNRSKPTWVTRSATLKPGSQKNRIVLKHEFVDLPKVNPAFFLSLDTPGGEVRLDNACMIKVE